MRASAFAPLALLILLSAAIPPTTALPTPGLFCDTGETLHGRLFPEPMESNDFISYDEALCGLARLQTQHPDWIRRDVVGHSVGWDALTGTRDTFEVFVVRVSDYAAPTPTAQKDRIVFQLSIHGNEKGGREGGLRVIEDLVRDLGFSPDHPHLRDMLQTWELLFVFPNPDGWTHEEAKYRHNDACYTSETCRKGLTKVGEPGLERSNFVRYNGNGVDVNREWPTAGWVRARHTPLSEPEAISLVDYLKRETNIRYASDIHGMLNPADGKAQGGDCALGLAFDLDPTGFDPTCFEHAVAGAPGHYVLTMLPAGRQEPGELALTTSLAQRVKDVLNSDPYFAEWRALPQSPTGWWGGEFNDWGTVWDTLGYTDSGFTSDFYAQDMGLNAPGVDFEFSYNHVTFDNYYPGLAQRMNAYHVQATRDIVRAFMEEAAQAHAFALDAQGTRTAWLRRDVEITNEGAMRAQGWPAENPADDAFDVAHRPYRASPDDYWRDLLPHLRNGVLAPIDRVHADPLADFDNLVVAGSAARGLVNDTAAKGALRAWVEAGGTLLLTDEALALLPDLGLAKPGSVKVNHTYAGHTNFVDKEHPLVADVRGLARQTFEPVPLGYNLTTQDAPVWHVETSALAEGVEVVGVAGTGQGAKPDPAWANFGEARLGKGRVVFLGALLPDPVATDAAFYGVESYATTYTANQLVRNALGWRALHGDEVQAAQTPTAGESATPGAGLLLVTLGGIAAALLLRRRR